MFSQASVILFTGGGVYPSMHWGRHPPADTPPLADTLPPLDGHCSGRYASYWNAFLFSVQKQSRRFLARLKILYEEFRAHRFRPCRSQDITVAPLGDYLLLPILTWAGGGAYKVLQNSGVHLHFCLVLFTIIKIWTTDQCLHNYYRALGRPFSKHTSNIW